MKTMTSADFALIADLVNELRVWTDERRCFGYGSDHPALMVPDEFRREIDAAIRDGDLEVMRKQLSILQEDRAMWRGALTQHVSASFAPSFQKADYGIAWKPTIIAVDVATLIEGMEVRLSNGRLYRYTHGELVPQIEHIEVEPIVLKD